MTQHFPGPNMAMAGAVDVAEPSAKVETGLGTPDFAAPQPPNPASDVNQHHSPDGYRSEVMRLGIGRFESRRFDLRHIALWICMAFLLPVYVWDVASLHPTNLFGAYHDDSIYFSSAKALAQGQGDIMPSFPGAPPQTKYPLLYPWLLSWVWRTFPAFPQNVAVGIGLTVFFGCWSLIAAFQLLRRLGGIGDRPALLLVGICALHPLFLTFSGRILSDLPFMALALTALVLADSEITPDGSMVAALLAGAIAGLSVGMRTMGLAVIAGIFVAALCRRALRQGLVFSAAAALVVAIGSWGQWMNLRAFPSWRSAFPPSPGWNQNLAYYTSYGAIWHVCVPNLRAFVALLKMTVPLLLLAPGRYLVTPLEETPSMLQFALAAIFTFAMVWGVIRQARTHGWKPIHFALPFYCVILLAWPYPLMGRFLLPFLPLFLAGFWTELSRLAGILRLSLRLTVPRGKRCLAGVVAILLVFSLVFAGWKSLLQERGQLLSYSMERGKAVQEQRQAYQWIREHAAPQDRIVAYEDPLLYLYTGRVAVRPAIISPSFVYLGTEEGLRNDAAHIADTAHSIGARFWMTTDSDFSMEGNTAVIANRMAEIKKALPLVFQSTGNTVQIYDSSCVVKPQTARCPSVAPVLFPAMP
jgi:hypothetical protein